MTLALYHNPQSRAVMTHVLLEELGVPYELKPVAYDDGSMRSPAFLALNPMGKIPVLVDGDTVVTETGAIAIYLADKFKSPNNLAPAIDDPRRGEYLRWIVFQGSCIDPAMTQKSKGLDLDRLQTGWGSPDLVVDTLEQRLERANPYLFGEWFTAADAVLGMAVGWAMMFKIFPERPAMKRYAGAVQTRPAFARVMAPA